jgi:hypothetical protein
MVEFKIRINPEQRLTRIPKILTQNFGTVWTLVPNKVAAVIFPENADLQVVLKSLGIIRQELQLQVESDRAGERGGGGSESGRGKLRAEGAASVPAVAATV